MYIQQAYKGKTDWWRFVMVFLMVVLLNFIASIPLVITSLVKSINNEGDISEFTSTMNPASLGLSQNAGLVLLIAPFVLVFIGLVFTIKLSHNIKLINIFTSFQKYRWNRFFYSILVWFLFLVLADIVYFLMSPEAYSFHFNSKQFFTLMLISFVFIPFQASWEELYFRGNLLQGIGLLSKTRWLPLILTAVLFGLVHLPNPEVKEYGVNIAMAQYIGFGLLLGAVVIMDGGLEMAFGLHLINNIYASVFVSYSGSVLQTPALISSKDINKTYILIAFFAAAFLFLIITKYVFKWKSFKWLVEPVKKPEIGSEYI